MSKSYNVSSELKTILLKNENYTPPNPLKKNKKPMLMTFLALISFFFIGFTANAQVLVQASNSGSTTHPYTNLKGAFNAINSGTHTGSITILLFENTDEGSTSTVINASGSGNALYTGILILPLAGGVRTITGATTGGQPLIHLNGADNVFFQGSNTDGVANSLAIVNPTVSSVAGTSTILFIAGATNNTITNCTLQGSITTSSGSDGGVILFSFDDVTANGNDNNTISNNDIGPAGGNMPSRAIHARGSTTTVANMNSGISITNNNIHDYFGPTVHSSGVFVSGGCTGWSITNNRFYQTGLRTFTAPVIHTAINIQIVSSGQLMQDCTITGNIIGYASKTQTGTYTLTGSGGSFRGIFFNGLTNGLVSNINSNTIAAVSLTGVTSSGTTISSPFTAIVIPSGLVNTSNNIIGSQSATGSLVYATTTTTATDVYGLLHVTTDNIIADNNTIGGISVTNAGTGTLKLCAFSLSTGIPDTNRTVYATSNLIGGTIANSIQLNATGTGCQVIGMKVDKVGNNGATCNQNTIRNLTTNSGSGGQGSASMIGIYIPTGTGFGIRQNMIYSLSNTNTTAASVVTGIQMLNVNNSSADRNFIYDLKNFTNSISGEINGIRTDGASLFYFRNNMISLGGFVTNAFGTAASNTSTSGINGIMNVDGGISFFIHNSIYIGGAATTGTGPSYAFNSTVTTTFPRQFVDNIFVNNRVNSGATGTHYSIKINGTTPNLPNLTLNYNLYFGAGTFGFFNGLDVANLANWKTAVGQDAASFYANPQFLNPGAAVPNLHINPGIASVAEGRGLNNLFDIDFDGEMRSGLTPADIGADAGNYLRANTEVTLKFFIEGFYTGGGIMRSVANNQDGVSPMDEAETVKVELYNASAPYAIVASVFAKLHTNGTTACSFPTLPDGSFYIAVKTKNGIQTWSSSPQVISPSTLLNYDFTTSAAKAYGSNMKNLGGGVFGFYSGDINQDEVIDGSDAPDLYNDADNSEFGVRVTDLNGDGSVDNSDTPFFTNNADNSIFSDHP